VALPTAIGQAEVAGCNKSFLQGLTPWVPAGYVGAKAPTPLRVVRRPLTKRGRTIKRNWHERVSAIRKSAPLEPKGAAPNNRLSDQSAEAGFAFPEKWMVIRNPFVPS
jgi:hypothetical protein